MPPLRPRCRECRRPQATCLCARTVAVPNAIPVLVLQHPLEVAHAKGTGRLLHLSLAHSRLEVGERFEPDALSAWILPGAVLLYPGGPAASPPGSGAAPRQLVVLDATWRKSRRMLHANPALHALPRLSLADPPPSRYGSRKAEAPAQRSTLEATLLALASLEGTHASHDQLLAVLDAEQVAWRARADLHVRATPTK